MHYNLPLASTAKKKPYVRVFQKKCTKNNQLLKHSFNQNKTKFSKCYVEIGCGVGFHPLHYCKANPNHILLAFERTKNKFASFQVRIDNHDRLENLIAVNTDATGVLPDLFLPGQVDGYFLLYPNPYPKEKQANKRWHRASFFHWILESLKPDGTILLATNKKFYIEEAKLFLNEFWKLKFTETQIKQGDIQPRTHFEKKYLESGQICYQLLIRKPKDTNSFT